MGLGLSLKTGGGDFVAGGDSGGGVAEYTPQGAFNLFNSLIFPSAREVHALLHLGKLAEVLVMSVLPSYRIFPFCNGFWPQNTTPENSVSFNGINYIPPLNVRKVFWNIIFGLSFPVLCWTLLTLSPSHPPLWRIDIPAVEKKGKK